MPNSAIKPIAADTLNGIAVTNSASTPPIIAMGMTLMASKVSDNRAEIDPEQQRDHDETERHDDLEAADGILQVAEFADPFHSQSGRQRHLGRDLCLSFLDRAAKIAVTHAEFDRQVALLLLAIDVRRPGQKIDGGHLG